MAIFNDNLRILRHRLIPLVAALVVLAGGLLAADSHRAAEITVLRMPRTLEVRSSATARLEIRNAGTEAWPAGGPVRVSYRWRSPDGDLLEGARTFLTAEVPPGTRVTVCGRIEAPAEAGDYALTWDLVHEGVAWFADERGSNAPSVPVRVTAPGQASRHATFELAVFFFLTACHFGLSLCAARTWSRAGNRGASRDDWVFAGILLGLATLLAILQSLAVTIGLTFAAAAATIALWNVVLGGVLVRHRTLVRDAVPPVPEAPLHEIVLEVLAVSAVLAVVVRWYTRAIATLAIAGTDAVHYHAPNAVNFALGVNPLDYTATPHLYPMGSSVLAAWFILPLNDPLLIDLSTAPAFLLAWAAIARLFRSATGASGLAWATWPVLALLATRLLDVATLFSADLMYAAGFLAVNTQLFVMARTRRAGAFDLCLAAGALGLLVGSKTTGMVSAVLLVGVYAAVAIASGARPERRCAPDWKWMTAAALLLVAAGGLWPVRNWVNYGSPIAPSGLTIFGRDLFSGDSFESTRYYLSIAGDAREIPGYAIAARLAHYVRQWLGGWFLPSLLLIVLTLVDAARASRRTLTASLARSRLALAASAIVLAGAHLMLIAQAPWSSLEWTRGHSLRYALPFALLLPLVAWFAVFPLSWRWWARIPRVVLPRVRVRGGPFAALALTAGLAGSWGLAAHAAAADARLRRAEDRLAASLRGCDAETIVAADRYALAYLAVLDYEQRTQSCARRRFFLTTRFDSPMALQPLPYTNTVHDARPRTIVERVLVADGPGTQSCDYVIASEAELQTTRGNLLINRLRTDGVLTDLGPAGPYRLFSARR